MLFIPYTELRTPHAPRRAFTLIELLVVVTIIVMLVAMLLPAATSAMSVAKRTGCLSNVRQLQVAGINYCGDNFSQFQPQLGNGANWSDSCWDYQTRLQAYYQSPKLLACPALDVAVAYNFNANWRSPGGGLASHSLPQVRQTSFTLMFLEWSANCPMSWHTENPQPYSSLLGVGGLAFWSGAPSCVSFVDGHASYTGIYYGAPSGYYSLAPDMSFAIPNEWAYFYNPPAINQWGYRWDTGP